MAARMYETDYRIYIALAGDIVISIYGENQYGVGSIKSNIITFLIALVNVLRTLSGKKTFLGYVLDVSNSNVSIFLQPARRALTPSSSRDIAPDNFTLSRFGAHFARTRKKLPQ